jgi:hypothetical protein
MSIQNKINIAKELYSAYGDRILQEKSLLELISSYRRAIQDTREVMVETGVMILCGACAAKDFGGCCAEGVEDWYDEWLLLSNLLMGVGIDHAREASNGCLFVGSRGCKLVARHSFCVNFLCPAINESLSGSDVQRLSIVSGAELFAGWIFEQELRRRLNHKVSERH